MKFKISFLFVAMMMVSVCAHAQSARNPLNREPVNIRLNKGVSPKKLSGMTFYRPDGTQFDRTDIAYGENGQKTSERNLRWDAEDGAWVDVSKNDYMYNGNTMLTLSSVFTGNSWSGSSKTEYHYNMTGKADYSFNYGWNKKTDSWSDQPVLKKVWNYNENGQVRESVKWYFNKNTEEWDIPVIRILYSYDEQGNQREEVIQSYGGSWKDVGKYTYSCNEKQDEVVCLSYVASGDSWIYDGKIVCSYDGDGDMARCEYYDNNANGSMNAYCVYGYAGAEKTESNVKDEDIDVYPNPAVSYFNLTVPEELVGKTAFFFDVSGRQKKSVLIGNASMKVDVSGLSTGVYFMKVDTYTKKIFIK
ncbi:MAG: T9SS type A sorting domain-containing protein [Tannerella sp.]|jgi:hypothetical protein|nr:T9SS type A sorting domain-containing protein [Tannerella sp.]